MRRFTVALAALMLASTPALAADDAIQGTITTFVDSFNRGDIPAAAATHAKDAHITDEFAPFSWNGPDALAGWGASFDKDARARGITEPVVKIGAPTRQIVTGDHAYVVVPSVYTFKQNGVAMSETAQMTFTLVRQGAGWKITSWTWTGPDPKPAG